MPAPIRYDAASLDLSPRVFRSTVVVASPAAGVETIICSVTCTGDIAAIAGVILIAFAAYTVGTDGVSGNLKVRRTNASGTTIVATGATNTGGLAATQLTSASVVGFDTGPTLPGQVYVATLLVGSGSAESAVSAASLVAIVV